MAKAYWIACYRSVSDASVLAKYASLAGPAIAGRGGRFLARGKPSKTYEGGLNERIVITEFESLKKAIEAYESPEYQTALAVLRGSAERDIRIIEGDQNPRSEIGHSAGGCHVPSPYPRPDLS